MAQKIMTLFYYKGHSSLGAVTGVGLFVLKSGADQASRLSTGNHAVEEHILTFTADQCEQALP